MTRFILRRLLSGALTVLVVFIINFVLIHAAPGNPIEILMGENNADPEVQAALEEKWGLNKSYPQQFWMQLSSNLKGDLGTSIFYAKPVKDLIKSRIGATILLGVITSILSVTIGTVLGIFCTRHEGSFVDTLLSNTIYSLNAMPSFWLGLMLMMVFATWLNILPTQGMCDVRADYHGIRHILDVIYHLILPTLVVVLISMPSYFRITKSSILQVTSEEFITTLRATGMNEKKIFNRYVFKNALLPTITIFGLSLAFLITGMSLIEIVFSWPGMGRLILDSIMMRDYPMLMGVYLVVSIVVAVMMIVLDIVYAFFDPRIRYDR